MSSQEKTGEDQPLLQVAPKNEQSVVTPKS